MTEPVALRRALTLPLLTLYGISTIIGAGIYVLVGKVAGSAGMYTPVAFLVAALLAALSVLSYAELAARYPRSAAEAVYVQAGLRMRWLSVTVGLMIAFVGIVSSATLVHGFLGYLALLVPVSDTWMSVAIVAALCALTIWGIVESVAVASFIALIEILGLALVLWATRGLLPELPARLPQLLPPAETAIWVGIVGGAFLAFYAFIGFEDVVNVAEEAKDAPHTVPRAVLLALGICTTLYLLVSAAAVLSVPPAELAASDAPLALVYERARGGPVLVISLIGLFSVINGVLVQIVMATRVLYGMSREGWLPELFGRVHPRTRTPVAGTLFVCAVVLGLSLWLPLITLAQMTSLVTLSIFALVNLSLWRIKRREPTPAGLLRIPIYVPVAGFFASAGLAVYAVFGIGLG